MKTTTYQQALANGEISLEIPVYESQHLFVSQKGIIKLSDSNHLTEGLLEYFLIVSHLYVCF
ncbi:hypothetical protein [Helicobacter typhlonius]|uniref:hypothetical protein n=1 Tax=Helicobacter typhlonius TaxID=76936 RepID=UPI002FE29557